MLGFDKAYNEEWLLASQLTLIVPIPAHAWSITEDGGTPDPELAKTPEGAKQVWEYLIAEGEDLSGYADNPLFDTISGPLALESFSDSGKVTLVKNDAYDGDDAANAETINFLPYTSTDAEVAAVRAGEVDYGYIPTGELANAGQYEDLGYDVVNWDGWAITYLPYNFNNPTMGAVYSQLYVRQALQHLVDQDTISDVVWHGAANPGYGPVPQDPDNKFLSDEQRDNPYPFDPDAATTLLEDNGWTLGSDGVYVCETGADCGEGIEDGQALSITILTPERQHRDRQHVRRDEVDLRRVGRRRHGQGGPAQHGARVDPLVRVGLARVHLGAALLRHRGVLVLPGIPDRRAAVLDRRRLELRFVQRCRDGRAHPEHPRRGR